MNIVRTFTEANIYHMSSRSMQKLIQQRRLKKLVAYVKNNSPKLAELYADIGENFTLQDLPVTNKQMIMENFNDWVTDRNVSLDEVKKFTEDKNNIGTLFMDKYIVAATSGSTGYPLIYLIDVDHYNTSSTINNCIKHRPICMLCSSNSFLISTGITLESMRKFPFTKKFMNLINSAQPMSKIVSQLNETQPKTLIGYVSTMEMLADEYKNGNLKIQPKEIVCCSEKLSENMKKYLKDVFGCKVTSVYACTEAGNMAYHCKCGHFHIFNGWTIIEPVDANNNPVPYGQMSEKILITNLANRTMPIIRYEVTDQVILHDEICECGNRDMWMEIEGRTYNKALLFKAGDKEIKLAPISMYCMIETMDSIRLFQLVVHGYDKIELRIIFMPGVDEKAVFEEVKTMLTDYLHENGVDDIEIYLSDIPPQIDPKTLKIKTLYQEF